jgi:hypothetical protein
LLFFQDFAEDQLVFSYMFSKLTNIPPLPLLFISSIIFENGKYARAFGEKVHRHNPVPLSQSTKFSVRQSTKRRDNAVKQ